METPKRFEGKVAIVTASTQGIGLAIAERLGLEGASVVISSRKQQNVDAAAEQLRAKGIQVLGVVCHVSSAQQRKNLIDKTVQKYGKIDVVVSNAAANPSVDAILQTKDSVLDKLWEINVKALAAEMAPNTRVNCVAPGFVPTNFASFITSNDAVKKELEEKTLLGRLGTTEDMGAAAAFLASDDAAYITGETIVVAGGTPSRL
uniref:Ketoreductase (KR) domain-containing protein n=1 Tax=Glycine max TaxID=3847 RepID=I1MR18_SOYBN